MSDDGLAIDQAAEAQVGEIPDTRPDTNYGEDANSPVSSEEFADAKADMTGSPAADNHPPVSGREAVLAAFGRSRAQASPQPAPPQPPRPPPPQPRPAEQRPWFAPEAQPQPALSEEAVDELCAGYAAGNLTAWPRRLLGPAPNEPGCRVPKHVLKRNGL